MDLKGLVHRELGEGLTEEELASTVGVSVETIANILADELPQDRDNMGTLCAVFSCGRRFPTIGGPPHSEGLFDLKESAHSLSPRPDEEGATLEVGSNRSDGHARRAVSCSSKLKRCSKQTFQVYVLLPCR